MGGVNWAVCACPLWPPLTPSPLTGLGLQPCSCLPAEEWQCQMGMGRLAPAAGTQLFPGHLQEHSLTVPFIWNSMAHVTSSFQGLSAPCLCCGNYRLTPRDCPSASHWISTLNPGVGCGSCRAGQGRTKISVGLTQCHPTQCTPCYSLVGNIYDLP